MADMTVLDVIVALAVLAVLIAGGTWLWARYHHGAGPPPEGPHGPGS